MDGPLASTDDALIFEATLRPHRSLSRRGLMALLGAWPVIGFNGADLLLAVVMIWLNIRAARAVETITLSRAALTVVKTDIYGRRARLSLAPYWLTAALRERPGAVPRLLLSSRGGETEIARQLGETEKRDLAAALTRALHRARNPSFDNPQLR